MKSTVPQIEVKLSDNFKKVFKIAGQVDHLPEDYQDLQYILDRIESLAYSFGFSKVEPAIFETHEVIKKFYSGENQPIKSTFGNGTVVAFRNSGLPGLLRMYLENRIPEREHLTKWYYIVPTVLHQDNPHQLVSNIEYGFEILGDESPVFDAQVLALGWLLYNSLIADNVSLEVGSRGCVNCWPEYHETLIRVFGAAKYSLCKECALQVDKNPEHVLSCEEPDCQAIAADGPVFIDYLDDACRAHLTHVLESLDELGVPYTLVTAGGGVQNSRRTTFRFHFSHPQDSFVLSSGSHHDNLFTHFETESRPALGLSGDINKLLRAWRLSGGQIEKERKADVALIPLGELACKKSLSLFSLFWDNKIPVVTLLGDHSLKLRLQQAAEMKIPLALVIGQKEGLDGSVILRDVKSGMQEVFPVERILSEVRKRLGE